ncbi:MAG: hypothetical protein ACKOCD_09270 [Nitrospiraceae bacterium]
MVNQSRIGLLLACWMAAGSLAGCALEEASKRYTISRIDEAIARYQTESTKVKLGDSRDKVLALLEPTQFELESNEIKPPVALEGEIGSSGDHVVVVHFFRSARHTDEAPDARGLPQDDDFTPYIFTDEVLTGVGWPTLLALRVKKPAGHAPKKTDPCEMLGPMAGCF